jgi:hypothetical protein
MPHVREIARGKLRIAGIGMGHRAIIAATAWRLKDG